MANFQITINPDELVRLMRKKAKVALIEQEAMARYEHLALFYEDDLADGSAHQTTATKVFTYLGVENHSVRAPYQKTTPDDWQKVVSNDQEVVAAIAQTEFAEFLK